MSEFSEAISSVLTIIFLVFMASVIITQYKKRRTADRNKSVGLYDGISENDGPIPTIVFGFYIIAFSGAVIYLLLFPGIASWKGLLNWSEIDDAYNGHSVNLNQQINEIVTKQSQDKMFTLLVQNKDITLWGEALYKDNCAACHTVSAKGQEPFPNLVDNDWLYGGDAQNILTTITLGRHGQMPAWKGILTDDQIDELTDFIYKKQINKQINPLFEQECAGCHGSNGKGMTALGSANLTDDIWLHGQEWDDIYHNILLGISNQMPAFGKRLSSNQLLAVSAYIISLQKDPLSHIAAAKPQQNSNNKVKVDAPQSATVCMSCHGKNGIGGIGNNPRLDGLSKTYIANQLHNFKNGNRTNALMTSMAKPLNDDAITQLANYFSSQPALISNNSKVVMGSTAAKIVHEGDPARQIVACTTCHGAALQGLADFPILVQQDAGYLKKQLLDWKSGKRKGDANNVMHNIASALTATEISEIADYISTLHK